MARHWPMLSSSQPMPIVCLQLPTASHVASASQVEPQSVPSGTGTQVPVAGSQVRQLKMPQSTGSGGPRHEPKLHARQVRHPLRSPERFGVRVTTHPPVAGSQTACWQSAVGCGQTAGVPTQVPSGWQTSPVVQRLSSSQARPTAIGLGGQLSATPSQTAASWHWSAATRQTVPAALVV
jgi:hypothetical protein